MYSIKCLTSITTIILYYDNDTLHSFIQHLGLDFTAIYTFRNELELHEHFFKNIIVRMIHLKNVSFDEYKYENI